MLYVWTGAPKTGALHSETALHVDRHSLRDLEVDLEVDRHYRMAAQWAGTPRDFYNYQWLRRAYL